MRAGNLRHRIGIQKKSITKNSYGENVTSWTTDAIVWAAIWPVSGKEYFNAQQVQAGITHKIRIRHRTLSASTRINPECRIRYGTRYFGIKSVINPDERNIYLDIMCEESI